MLRICCLTQKYSASVLSANFHPVVLNLFGSISCCGYKKSVLKCILGKIPICMIYRCFKNAHWHLSNFDLTLFCINCCLMNVQQQHAIFVLTMCFQLAVSFIDVQKCLLN